MPLVKSIIPGAGWPGIPSPLGAQLLAQLYQLDHSQWWPRTRVEAAQSRQLGAVLAHAAQTVPFYRERLRAAGITATHQADPAAFARLPLLTRRDIQAHGTALMSTAVPREHGNLVEHKSGGSTGEPVRVFGTELNRLFWYAHTLRDHLWQKRNFTGKLCAIRSRVESGTLPSWGPTTDSVFVTGPGALLNIRTETAAQLAWLQQQDGDYLLSHPTNVRELARLALARGVKLPRLKQVRTFGEALPAALRDLCREAWGVRVTDTYSAEEVGYIALQCPEHEHYHVQSEHLLVEVLDDGGQPCAPGQTGRVVVTPLHNYAMPLIRYVLGDYAEAGAPCDCGRGLPVLTRIHGRSRNMLVLPDGRRYWPSTPIIRYAGIAPIQQLQIVQHTRESVEARFVAARALHADEERNMIAAIQEGLDYPFSVTLTQMAEIQRSPSMKYEDIVSHVAAAEDLAS